ncbi:ribonuclease R [Streptococcus pacificus]|uniref:Ribonuclease R n=1 Tax=Streptococcus pacificus TaxID=2740577 RepID=A0ABS0ZI78_9STRE|nr:ribonuclease R [Streptococcus pacificus]MBJ8325695.1 ribonuclease R [Streptococcus pacificus]
MKELLLNYLKEHGPSSVDTIAKALEVDTSTGFRDLIKIIAQLDNKGILWFNDQGDISLKEAKKKKDPILIEGVFRANRAGFGFISIEGEEADLFVSRQDTANAIDGDIVKVSIKKVANRLSDSSAEAEIVEIVERSIKTVVGSFVPSTEKNGFIGYIKSKNQKISQKIYLKKTPLVLDGTEVLKVDISSYPTKENDYFVAEITDIIGHKGEVGIDVLEVLESMDIASKFPDEVIKQANSIPDKPSQKDYLGRVDLRNEITFTIDGADAKDLDDAIHIKALDNGHFELGVHIADVSYYVTENSPLDKEALARGTSVYVTDRVVPMLPERLSNGICSLNPNVDRLTLSAIMEINQRGKVVRYQIAPSVINTTYRMTYSDVNQMIAGDEELLQTYSAIKESVEQMVVLHNRLEKMREKRGSLNFDTTEAKIIVNDKGFPIDIAVRERGLSERMIESFMLAANECVAEHFAKLELPFIYRVHEEPKAEKVQKFIDYASVFGVKIQGTANKITQTALQTFMKNIKGQPGSEVLSMMLLRSMQQARYSEHNHGHYGLAAEYYTHFTSPIRRYPDLLVHRLIREYENVSHEKIDHFNHLIPEIASQSSQLERRAVDAERTVESMKKAEYMSAYVGEEFDGIIGSIVKFGLFVELPNTIEGLIHVTNLPEYYHYNERGMLLQGEKSGKVFRVGQPIRVKLVNADKETGDIDFEYLPSDFDVVEKRIKVEKNHRRRSKAKEKNPLTKHGEKKANKQSLNKKITKAIPKKKGEKMKYKEVIKKGGGHGKRRGKTRRTK